MKKSRLFTITALLMLSFLSACTFPNLPLAGMTIACQSGSSSFELTIDSELEENNLLLSTYDATLTSQSIPEADTNPEKITLKASPLVNRVTVGVKYSAHLANGNVLSLMDRQYTGSNDRPVSFRGILGDPKAYDKVYECAYV